MSWYHILLSNSTCTATPRPELLLSSDAGAAASKVGHAAGVQINQPVRLGGGVGDADTGVKQQRDERREDDDYPGAHPQGRQEYSDRDLAICLVYPEAAWLERWHVARSVELYKLMNAVDPPVA
jgi:hypothetical protein